MKKVVLTYLILFAAGLSEVLAQNFGVDPTTGRDRFGNQVDPNMVPDDLRDSTNTEILSLPPKVYTWRISERFGDRTILPADTAELNFQNQNLMDGMTGHYNHLGNLGSPRLSRIYFEREADEPTIFMAPYSSFYKRPDEILFTNSNIPYTNLSYWKAGDKVSGEERFKSYFSVNVNKRTAFGFNFDYLYGRGFYQNQSTAHFNAGVFGSYIGERYQIQGVYNNYFMKMNENGGITDDQYITKPENMAQGKKQYEANTIPVNLEQTANRNHDFYVYVAQRYNMGFKKRVLKKGAILPAETAGADFTAVRDTAAIDSIHTAAIDSIPSAAKDSIHTAAIDSIHTAAIDSVPSAAKDSAGIDLMAVRDSIPADTVPRTGSLPIAPTLPDSLYEEVFVPVSSFIHTVKLERSKHRFRSQGEPSGFFPEESIYDSSASNDSTTAFSIKNTFGIALLEGFNKYAKAGLTAYITHKYSKYTLMNPDTASHANKLDYSEQELYVGGELTKREGTTLHYHVNGEVGILDKAAGQFRIDGNLDLNFRLWRDTVNFIARASVSNTLPSFYMRHYHSNHYNWDNDDLDKVFRTRIEGELNIDRWGTNLKAGVENIKNYTYFDQYALPQQCGDNIQVFSATLTQNFKLGILHLDNEVTYQKSGNEDVLPLPQLSLYHNLYILTKIAKKVLNVQLGADVRYFSKYYAPDYAPGVQQFHLQREADRVEIGGYPFVNVYANLQLKRTRFFIMMSHVNAGMGDSNYFLAPHYPVNQRLLKFGLSWNFYD